ncbi:hypothetical protein ACFUIY_19395 [Streptomyces griseorubiginosus]|uniref:hypothetical protein n=1 Tax=Streptomyces griseorubiginosus TaxID=67304 RepID=UPI003628F854
MSKSNDLRIEDLLKMDGEEVGPQAVKLKPNDHRMMGLGVYEVSQPEPDFDVVVTPAERESEIGISFDHLSIPDRPDKYLVVLHLQSWSDKLVNITIKPVQQQPTPRK